MNLQQIAQLGRLAAMEKMAEQPSHQQGRDHGYWRPRSRIPGSVGPPLPNRALGLYRQGLRIFEDGTAREALPKGYSYYYPGIHDEFNNLEDAKANPAFENITPDANLRNIVEGARHPYAEWEETPGGTYSPAAVRNIIPWWKDNVIRPLDIQYDRLWSGKSQQKVNKIRAEFDEVNKGYVGDREREWTEEIIAPTGMAGEHRVGRFDFSGREPSHPFQANPDWELTPGARYFAADRIGAGHIGGYGQHHNIYPPTFRTHPFPAGVTEVPTHTSFPTYGSEIQENPDPTSLNELSRHSLKEIGFSRGVPAPYGNIRRGN